MRSGIAIGLAFACFGAARVAAAEEHAPRRFDAAVSVGYSSGSVLDVPGFTFVELDAAYHLTPRWSVGPYAEVGFIDTTVQRQEGLETFLGHHYRFGGQTLVQLFPRQVIDPWLGMGLGYAALGVDVHSTSEREVPVRNLTYSETARGFEWLNLQCGLNLNLAHALALGGFARLSVVEYLSQYPSAEAGRTTRAWLSGGVKGTLRF